MQIALSFKERELFLGKLLSVMTMRRWCSKQQDLKSFRKSWVIAIVLKLGMVKLC